LVCPSYHEPLVTYDQLDWPRLRCDRLVSRAKVYREPGRILGLVYNQVSYKGDLYKLLLVQVMASLTISISLDLSDESVGSSFLRVVLIGSISVDVPVTPEVGAVAVASPAGVA
nr:hypothetical protein [Tanacetum cinerariifolium]